MPFTNTEADTLGGWDTIADLVGRPEPEAFSLLTEAVADVDERYRLGHEVNAMRATLKRTGAVDLGNGITLRIIRDELHGNVTADMTSA